MTMTKRDIYVKVAQKTGIPREIARDAVQTVLDSIAEELAKGARIELRDFGVFEIVTRKSRVGRNPNNPTHVVTIPERKVVKFRTGDALRNAVDKL